MRRTIIIFILILLLVLLGAGLYFLFFAGKTSQSGLNSNPHSGQSGTLPAPTINSSTSTDVGSITSSSSTLPDYLGQASDFFGPLPTTASLTIGTAQGAVQVNNFYLSNPPVNQDEDVVIKQAADYYIVYDPSDSNFWLGISGTPFATWRPVAEADFLTTLGINQANACKLSVTSGVIYLPGNPADGQSLPLSFCVSGAFGGK
jgi:hypothetical protein